MTQYPSQPHDHSTSPAPQPHVDESSEPTESTDLNTFAAAEDQAEPRERQPDDAESSHAADELPEDNAGSAEDEQDTRGEVMEDEPLVYPGFDWFVLRVASNKEDSVKETLLRKIKIEGMTHLVNRILVPTEKIRTMKGGKQKVQQRKLYPGYVFVEMQLEADGRIPQDVFFLIKETTGVGDFIGTAGRPAPMQRHEVEKMVLASRQPEEEPEVRMEFAPGDVVKIKEGPFENMDGTVDALLPEQGKVRVIVTIFGRATPLEIEYWQIEKADE